MPLPPEFRKAVEWIAGLTERFGMSRDAHEYKRAQTEKHAGEVLSAAAEEFGERRWADGYAEGKADERARWVRIVDAEASGE